MQRAAFALPRRSLQITSVLPACRGIASFQAPTIRQPRAAWYRRRTPLIFALFACTQATASEGGEGSCPQKKMTLRFKVGDRVGANTSGGWQLGTVIGLHYREPDWPEDQRSAPYQIELDSGDAIYAPGQLGYQRLRVCYAMPGIDKEYGAPEDTPDLVRAEDQIPWHKKQQRAMANANVAEIYPAKAKYPELFKPDNVDSWFVPALREALSEWQFTGDPKKIDIAKIPGLRLEAPGVVSFECLEPEFCDKLLLDGKPSDLENWGGATVSDHHTARVCSAKFETDLACCAVSFIVRYRPDEDRHLDMHVDECDVTFNFGLCNPDSFKGSDLAFCGMFGSPEHRKHLHTYAHVKGRCVLHSGKRRHGALNVEEGERASLIMWTKSPAFRRTAEYQRRWGDRAIIQPETGTPDRVCLSYTHDRDFNKLRRTLGDATGVTPEPKM